MYAGDAPEDARHVALIHEPGLERQLGQGHLGVAEPLLHAPHAQVADVLTDPHAEPLAEHPRQPHGMNTASLRQAPRS